MEEKVIKYHYEAECLVHKDNTAETQKFVSKIYYIDSEGNGKDKTIMEMGVTLHPKEIQPRCEMCVLSVENDNLYDSKYLIGFVAFVLEHQMTYALNNILEGRRYKSKDIDISPNKFLANVNAAYVRMCQKKANNYKKILFN